MVSEWNGLLALFNQVPLQCIIFEGGIALSFWLFDGGSRNEMDSFGWLYMDLFLGKQWMYAIHYL